MRPAHSKAHSVAVVKQPAWLARRIASQRRAAVEEACARCGARVLVGDDDDRCAARVAVDAVPVADRLHEVVELVRDRRRVSFDLVPVSGERCELWPRWFWHTGSARPDKYPIHLLHVCE